MRSLPFIAAMLLSVGAAEALIHNGCAQKGFVGSVEYLYWEALEGNLAPVLLIEEGIVIKNQKFEYTSGVRGSVGYQWCELDALVSWTYYNPSTTISFNVSDPSNLIALPFFDQTDSDVPHAMGLESRWNMQFNMGDLEFGRQIGFGRFTLRPHFGLKGGTIHQKQTMKAHDVIIGQTSSVEAIAQGTVHRKNDFWGIGPRVGVDLRCALASEVGLFSTLSGALLYGKYDLKTTTFLSETFKNGMSAGPSTVPFIDSQYGLSPTVQFILGADWATPISNGCWIRLGVAYEAQYWWNQMRSVTNIPQTFFTSAPANCDLSLHGLTVQASFEF